MEQESKSMEIRTYRSAYPGSMYPNREIQEDGYVLYADHAAALKAAQDTIAVEKRALLNANAELAKYTEKMRVMREALLRGISALNHLPPDKGPIRQQAAGAIEQLRAALASTAPVKRCGCGMGPDEICETCNGTGYANAAPVAEAGQKERK